MTGRPGDVPGGRPDASPPEVRAGRAQPRQQRAHETLARILEAADVEISMRGSAGATTTTIARRAGVSVGALYRFFPDKHAIGDALADRYRVAAMARFGPMLARMQSLDDVPTMIRSVVRVAAELQLEHRGYYRLTQEIRPDLDESPGRAVRTAIVEAFDERLTALGAGTGSAEQRRAALELAIETVRHTLVVAATAGSARESVLIELETMIVTYAVARLGLAT